MNAFPRETAKLAAIVREAEIDAPALMRPLKACDLSQCRGTCCHDGVYVSAEEAEAIRNLNREELAAVGAFDLPEKLIEYGNWRGMASGPKTATRPVPMRQWVPDYPTHFAETNCIFLLPDARCALQALAMEQGKRPWFYKPFTCWIHPLSFASNAEGKPLLTLFDEEDDPHRFPDYDGFVSRTHCGRTCQEADAKPAYEVLRGELEALGEIGGRDLVAEILEID